MDITIEMIEQVLDSTNGDYRTVKQALIDNEGDIEKAIEAVKEAQAQATVVDIEEYRSAEAGDGEEAPADGDAVDAEASDAEQDKSDWSTDEFAEDMVERIKSKIKGGNVDHIRITKDDKVLLDLPVNIGILGGVIGTLAFPWAMVAGVLVGYGLNCKVEIVTKDGGTEEL